MGTLFGDHPQLSQLGHALTQLRDEVRPETAKGWCAQPGDWSAVQHLTGTQTANPMEAYRLLLSSDLHQRMLSENCAQRRQASIQMERAAKALAGWADLHPKSRKIPPYIQDIRTIIVSLNIREWYNTQPRVNKDTQPRSVYEATQNLVHRAT